MIEPELLEALLATLPIITVNILTPVLGDKLRIQRISKYNECLINAKTFTNKNNNKHIDKNKIKILLPYINKLSNYINKENLNTIYTNLSTINIKRKPFIILLGAKGTYDMKDNSIEYSISNSIGHEFLHAASSEYDKETEISYAGFLQQKKLAFIGKGLNEGYTELLASRLYNKNNKVKAYDRKVRIANLFEFFFDNPKDMEKYYFNHDLPGFIHHMEQFAKRQEIIDLILKIDSIYQFYEACLNPLPIFKNIEIQLILYKWFTAKNNNTEKQKEFENILCKNKVIDIMLNNKIKLCKTNPYDTRLEKDIKTIK